MAYVIEIKYYHKQKYLRSGQFSKVVFQYWWKYSIFFSPIQLQQGIFQLADRGVFFKYIMVCFQLNTST